MGIPHFFPITSITMIVPGLWFLIRGLRGKIVGDHPHCTQCGFDLHGLPSESENCPECGRNIRSHGATRAGQRVRRGRLVLLGLGLLLPATLWLGILIWLAASHFNLTPYKPTWWLTSNAMSSIAAERDPAIVELTKRMTAGKLTAGEIDRLVDRILIVQADANKTWQPVWGDFLEQAHGLGKVSDERWNRYGINALLFPLSLSVRPRVRFGDPIPYMLNYHGPARVGQRNQLHVNFDGRQIYIGEMTLKLSGSWGTSLGSSGTGGGGFGSVIEPSQYRGRLKPGAQLLRFKGLRGVRNSPRGNGKPYAQQEIDLSVPFTLLPEGQPTVTVNHDEANRAKIEAALSMTAQYDTKWKSLSVMVNMSGIPTGIGFDVTAKCGEKQWNIGYFASPAKTGSCGYGLHGDIQNFPGEEIDLILKPSVEAAANTTDTLEIWGGEVVIKGVKVVKR